MIEEKLIRKKIERVNYYDTKDYLSPCLLLACLWCGLITYLVRNESFEKYFIPCVEAFSHKNIKF